MVRMIRRVVVGVMLLGVSAASAEERVTQLTEPAESVRLRGGFSVNGGGGFGVAGGGTASVAARLGVQFNRYFSTSYQASPMAFFALNENGVATGLLFANSLLATVTLGDFLDVGVGPSLDYSAIAGCSATVDCEAARGLELGVHGRLAFNLGGRDQTGRRSGFSLGVDVHPVFTAAGPLYFVSAGLGGEWF